ncbi:hypothetical protein PROFUN_04061 [Planoprotostelium fungivorum]|uniref:Uncharacterized protein n=1 Tax=Planoprotostelium fungivorum TaxID=1890364 RepID=A0A2P6NJD8_9EUKA|nr:hypothetical protein PROFUN_04061 [Planoprotostelium fungivorum]
MQLLGSACKINKVQMKLTIFIVLALALPCVVLSVTTLGCSNLPNGKHQWVVNSTYCEQENGPCQRVYAREDGKGTGLCKKNQFWVTLNNGYLEFNAKQSGGLFGHSTTRSCITDGVSCLQPTTKFCYCKTSD